MPTPQEVLDVETTVDGRRMSLHVEPSTGNHVLQAAGLRMAIDRNSQDGRALVEEDCPTAIVSHCDGTAGAVLRCLMENQAVRASLQAPNAHECLELDLRAKVLRLVGARENCARCALKALGSK